MWNFEYISGNDVGIHTCVAPCRVSPSVGQVRHDQNNIPLSWFPQWKRMKKKVLIEKPSSFRRSTRINPSNNKDQKTPKWEDFCEKRVHVKAAASRVYLPPPPLCLNHDSLHQNPQLRTLSMDYKKISTSVNPQKMNLRMGLLINSPRKTITLFGLFCITDQRWLNLHHHKVGGTWMGELFFQKFYCHIFILLCASMKKRVNYRH